MGRTAGRDAGSAGPERRHPHPGPVPTALRRSPSDHALLHPRRVRRVAAAGGRDGLSPRGGGPPGALELPRVGAGRARDGVRPTPTAPRLGTATAPPAEDGTPP